MLQLLVAFLSALAAGFLITPVIRSAAFHWKLVDKPDKHRKLHGREIPLGGGVAVLLAWMAAGGVCALHPGCRAAAAAHLPFLLGLGGAAIVLCAVGVIDDRFGLRGRQKLAGQLLAGSILVFAGLNVEVVQLFQWRLELGLLAIPFTLFWLLGSINAVNLMDGIDGLATSLGIILSLTFAGMAWAGGHELEALAAVALAGALLAFLRFNFPPAKMFLGDAGSMLIGLVVGVLAIRASLKGPATVALTAALAAWAIPIFDVSMAIVRRKLTGRSIYATDRCHLHHQLLRRGFSHRKTLIWIGALSLATACGALGSVYQRNEMLAIVSSLSVLSMMVVTGFFGYSECQLIFRRAKGLIYSLWPRPSTDNGPEHSICTRMQGEQHWELFWETVTDFAEKFDLQSVRLNVNLPVLHEEYHASLVRKPRQDDRLMWSSEFPLRAHGLCVGSLTLTGIAAHDFVSDRMATLFGGLQQVERHLHELLEDAAAEMTLRATVAELTVLSKLSDHTAASRSAPVVSIVGGE